MDIHTDGGNRCFIVFFLRNKCAKLTLNRSCLVLNVFFSRARVKSAIDIHSQHIEIKNRI